MGLISLRGSWNAAGLTYNSLFGCLCGCGCVLLLPSRLVWWSMLRDGIMLNPLVHGAVIGIIYLSLFLV